MRNLSNLARLVPAVGIEILDTTSNKNPQDLYTLKTLSPSVQPLFPKLLRRRPWSDGSKSSVGCGDGRMKLGPGEMGFRKRFARVVQGFHKGLCKGWHENSGSRLNKLSLVT